MARRLLALAPWLATACVGAAPCERTGADPPKGPTLMASRDAPARVALIVSPDCSVHEESAIDRLSPVRLNLINFPVEYIVSLPSEIQEIGFYDAKPIAQLAGLPSARNLVKIDFPGEPVSALNGVKFPDNLKEIESVSGSIVSTASFQFPAGLTTLTIYDNQIRSADIAVPASVTELNLGSNPITKLDRVTFSSTIRILDFNQCGITTVRGCKFPASLTSLTFGNNPITNFEVRETDYQILSQLSSFNAYILQSKCSDSIAKLVQMQIGQGSGKICVISDTRFESLYGPSTASADGGATNPSTAEDTPESTKETTETKDTTGSSNSSPSSTPQTPSKSNSTSSAAGSASESGSEPSLSPAPTGAAQSTGGSSSSAQDATLVDGRGVGRSETRGDGLSKATSAPSSESTSTSSSSKTTVIVIANIGGVVAILVVSVAGYRVVKARRNAKHDSTSSGYTTLAASSGAPLAGSTSSRRTGGGDQFLDNDVRNDASLVGLRIDEREIQLVKLIARGGFGVVHHGRYRGADIAVKYLLPGGWRDTDKLTRFMDEIRISASIQHERVVALVGIAWTSLADLAAIMEYMDAGDLARLLYNEPGPSLASWTQPWSTSNIKSKTQIAGDVADAIAYLHSLSPPILHRDLKARNILLDTKVNVKISDFGVSRKLQLDAKMTGEIGTVAWIAPEVLRGDRYDELADIYSFGVVLVELDRGRHPYALRDESTNDDSHMQIAMQVSTGQLRPTVSSHCPPTVRALAEQCLSFDAASRPRAAEICLRLKSETA